MRFPIGASTAFARACALVGTLLTVTTLWRVPANAEPAPSPVPSPSPVPAPSHPLSFRGFFRAYDFTRQNASTGIGGGGQVNQQSVELGLGLHAEYAPSSTPFSAGLSYLVATPLNGCASPASHLSPPCGKLKAPGLNPDDSLPGFALNALYEAYVQYKDPRLYVRLGDQVFNTPWTSSSDTRIKPTAFQGIDVVYSVSPVWSLEFADMIRFQGRVNSTFENNTLLTSFPAGTAGVPANIYVPGGTSIPTGGLQYARIGYAGTNGFTSTLHLYHFDDIANLAWFEAKYTALHRIIKPFIAVHGGYERDTGAAVLGKIFSTPLGVQVGASVARNIVVTGSYERIPSRSDTIRLPAHDSCNANQQLVLAKGVSFPYLLPVNAPQCSANANGTTTIQYGGFASPYTDAYGTDPLWVTSLTQSPIDRHAPFSGPKIQATWTSNDKRLILYVTQSFLQYGSAGHASAISEINGDVQYFANPIHPGPYKGLLLRYRYGSRRATNVTTYGGLPLFRYNRAQLEYDF